MIGVYFPIVWTLVLRRLWTFRTSFGQGPALPEAERYRFELRTFRCILGKIASCYPNRLEQDGGLPTEFSPP